jgi:hypothetical protein
MMVIEIQSGTQWAPKKIHEGYKAKEADEKFALSPKLEPKKTSSFDLFGADGFTTSDAIDIVNPLQHLPVIGSLYREFTGDSLDPFSRIVGNTLFFGPFGAAFSSVNVAVEVMTGKDMVSNLIAVIKDENTNTTEPKTAHTHSINLTTPTIDTNNNINPVLAWATAEIKHQNSEALKQGLNLPTRPYSTLITSIVPSGVHPTQAAISYAQPESKKLIQKPSELDFSPTATPKKHFQNSVLALNVLKKDIIKSPPTLHHIKHTTNSYKSVTAYTNQSSIEQPAKPTAPNPYKPNTSQAQLLGSISQNGGWFSASMNDALSKYHQAKSSKLLHNSRSAPIASSLR